MKKLLSCFLLFALLLGCTCALAETTPVTIIDFADGNYAFLGVDMTAGKPGGYDFSLPTANERTEVF